MDNITEETIRKIKENCETLKELRIGNHGTMDGRFTSCSQRDFSRLGKYIGENTHLQQLEIQSIALNVLEREFYDGLKHNSSINRLILYFGNSNVYHGIEHEILKIYEGKPGILRLLHVEYADLQHGGDQYVASMLKKCSNLKDIKLSGCNITDDQLLLMVNAIKDHTLLEKLCLGGNRIGNAGCQALGTLLSDPSPALHTLLLCSNLIDNKGAAILANSLANNTRLQKLYLEGNEVDSKVENVFSKLVCDKSSVNSVYSSNHTLKDIQLSFERIGAKLASLLRMNRGTNKSHVAIKKILQCYPSIDMEPLFEWDAEGEQTLKALPYVIAWLHRAREALHGDASSVSDYTDSSDYYGSSLSHNSSVSAAGETTVNSSTSEDDSNNEASSMTNTDTDTTDDDSKQAATDEPQDGDRKLAAAASSSSTTTEPPRNVGNSIIDTRELSAIFQFGRAMPLLFVPEAVRNKFHDRKRKRRHMMMIKHVKTMKIL